MEAYIEYILIYRGKSQGNCNIISINITQYMTSWQHPGPAVQNSTMHKYAHIKCS